MKKVRLAVILAGGKGRRMGFKDKAMISLKGKTLIERSLYSLRNQTDCIAINCYSYEQCKHISSNVKICKKFEFISDNLQFKSSGSIGPLAGIYEALIWTEKKYGKNSYVLTVPVDVPFLPDDLYDRLYYPFKDKKLSISIAKSNGRTHPTIALWSTSIKNQLRSAIESGIRKIDIFTAPFNKCYVEWNNTKDPFFNINYPEDLSIANDKI